MNDLMLKGKPTIESREIAKMLDVEHWKILRKLEGTENSKGILEILGNNKIVVSDYFIKSTYVSEQNKTMPCYLFTRLGCDFIANKFTGEKGILFTAKYVKRFEEMEQIIKNNKYEGLSPLLQTLINMELKQKEQDEKIEIIGEKVDNIKNVVALNPNNWRRDATNIVNKIASAMGGYEHIKAIREESYKLLNERCGVNLTTRLINKRNRAAGEGMCKSKLKKLNPLDVIAEDKKLIEGYVSIIKEMAVKYDAANQKLINV